MIDHPKEDVDANERDAETAAATKGDVGGWRAPLHTWKVNVELIEQFAAYQRGRGFSPATMKRRSQTLRAFAAHLRPSHLGEATTVDIEEWLALKPAARTRHAYRSDLRVFYAWATRRRLIDSDPAAVLDSVKVPKALPRPIGPEVQAALSTGTARARMMVGLGLLAGLRCAEIAAIDAADLALHLDPPLLAVRNGKGGKDRVVPIHPALAELLASAPTAGRLFAGRSGRPVQPASVSTTIRRQFERLGIKATPHQLRHSFGTEMARVARGNLVAVAAVMGHGSTQTTMGYVGWSGESATIIASMFGDDAA